MIMENVKSSLKVRNNPNLNTARCPLDISVIPNYMGINLSNVESVDWEQLEDGQMVSLTIKFIPSKDSVRH